MTQAEIKSFIEAWIESANQFDAKKYLSFFMDDAVLDDPSVGSAFEGHNGIRDYFESYFIGYNTHTRLVKLNILSKHAVHVEVHFTGTFPGGAIGGTFDITFQGNRISFIKADLIH